MVPHKYNKVIKHDTWSIRRIFGIKYYTELCNCKVVGKMRTALVLILLFINVLAGKHLLIETKQAGTCISCEDLSVYKSDKKSNKNKVNDNLL